MNGPQDLGGQMGFGPIAPEPNEPIFHADWERRALGLTLACGALGAWSIDRSRLERESLPPAVYYSSSYYEIWIRALTGLLLKNGFVEAGEIERGDALKAPHPRAEQRLQPAAVAAVLARGSVYHRPAEAPPHHAVGATVRTRNLHPRGHTRLPRYARGKIGRVEAVQGFFVFPDTNAAGTGENPQWLYTVVFDGGELWGPDGDPGLTVSIDAFESYLEPA